MTQTQFIISLVAITAILVAIVTAAVVRNGSPSSPRLSVEQQAIREKFFGTSKEPAPIPKGQEMRPRW